MNTNRNIKELIIAGLPQKVVALIRKTGETAESMSLISYLVGGIVRDIILRRPVLDIDIMVEGDAIKLAGTLSIIWQLKPTTHSRFGTATFNFADYRLDLSSCRSETYSRPGALPSVKPGSIEEDLFRRDFTVNAMAVCINTKRFGELVDPYGGCQDLKKKLIRVLHDHSFTDDATRIMRAVRYEQRLNFRLEKHTAALLARDLDMLDTISGDRLRREVLLWLEEEKPWKIIHRADGLGILSKLHRSLKWEPDMRRAFVKAAADGKPVSPYLLFSLMTYHLSDTALYELLQRLNLIGTKYDLVCHQMLNLGRNLNRLAEKNLLPADIYFFLKEYSVEAIETCLLYSHSQRIIRRLRLYLDKLRCIKPALSGIDLIKMGATEGPEIGQILRQLLVARLNGSVKSKKDEEKLAIALLTGFEKPGLQP